MIKVLILKSINVSGLGKWAVDREYKVKIFHWREFGRYLHFPSPFRCSVKCNPRGGKTEIWIMEGEKVIGKSIAECNPKDAYNKRFGLKICFGRFVKKYLKKKLKKIEWGINEVTLYVE